jgi:predicted nucleotidyltransferase component of viral defense system
MLHLNTIDSNTHATLLSLLEKDYLDKFSLAGGTSLALRFGHRNSIDLDFFSIESFDPLLLRNILQADYPDLIFSGNNKYMLFCTINSIKVDFVYHPYPLIEPSEIIENIRLFSLKDVVAMKFQAITQRGSKKDFYDLWQLLQLMQPEELIKIYADKYGEQQIWMMLTSVTYFYDAEEQPEPKIFVKDLNWREVKTTIKNAFTGIKL